MCKGISPSPRDPGGAEGQRASNISQCENVVAPRHAPAQGVGAASNRQGKNMSSSYPVLSEGSRSDDHRPWRPAVDRGSLEVGRMRFAGRRYGPPRCGRTTGRPAAQMTCAPRRSPACPERLSSNGTWRPRGSNRPPGHLEEGRHAGAELLFMGGSPGTGKTTLSATQEIPLDGMVLSSDAVRKKKGTNKTFRSPAAVQGRVSIPRSGALEHTTSSWCAQRNLEMGRSVILDATWASNNDARRRHRLSRAEL